MRPRIIAGNIFQNCCWWYLGSADMILAMGNDNVARTSRKSLFPIPHKHGYGALEMVFVFLASLIMNINKSRGFSIEEWHKNANTPLFCLKMHTSGVRKLLFNLKNCRRSNRAIPQFSKQISHNTTFCNRNVHTCPLLCYKMVHCGICDWWIVNLVQQRKG